MIKHVLRTVPAIIIAAIALSHPVQAASAPTGADILLMPLNALHRYNPITNTVDHPAEVWAKMVQPWAEIGDRASNYAMEHPQTVAFVAGCVAALAIKSPGECQTWGLAATEVVNKIIAEQIWKF